MKKMMVRQRATTTEVTAPYTKKRPLRLGPASADGAAGADGAVAGAAGVVAGAYGAVAGAAGVVAVEGGADVTASGVVSPVKFVREM